MFKAYHKKGMTGGVMISLMVSVGIMVLVSIFISALSGQTFDLVEDDITAISNTAIRQSVMDSIFNSFDAQEQATNYQPLIVLAVVIGIILMIIMGIGVAGVGGGGGGGGSVL